MGCDILEDNIIKVGTKAPDFILHDQNKNEIALSELKGKKVLLSFHPLAWTSICAKQMQSLEANYERFVKLNAIPLGISVDSVPTKKAWADHLKITQISLLADFWPHGKLAQTLGIFREKEGISGRVNIVIDENQMVSFIKIYDIPELPDIEEILQFLEK
ncbi:MAG: redoxin domain-containing protein [Candidatus Heimdallarchaeota archaeon]|nr:redoxin domain-containing protein [Candidatus Heimdallarchaeota archaeon]